MSDISFENITQIQDRFGLDDNAANGANTALWHSASRTDIGRVRHLNEDALLELPSERLWVVADGLGGHSRGDYASNAVVKNLHDFSRQSSLADSLLNLEARLVAVNEQCRTAFRDKRPGTTVVGMLAHGDYCFFLWAGDSRLYRLRDGQLDLLTQDHSLAQQKHARGELTKEEKRRHASAHVLTRAVGVHKTLRLDLGVSTVQQGDRFLLCSDGLYNLVDRADIGPLLGQDTPENACAALVDRALEQGGRDNITVVVIERICTE